MKSRRIRWMVVFAAAVFGGMVTKAHATNYEIYKSDIENRMGGAHAITFTQDASIFEVVLKDGPTTIQVSKAADKISAVKVIWQTQFGNEILIPSLTATQRDSFTAVKGMLIFNTTLNKFQIRENGSWDSFVLGLLDEDNMVSDSATDAASQQSIKKYVDDNMGSQMVVVVDEKAANTDGGTCTSGTWQTRILNTFRVNDDTIGSLASNQITLPAGIYECWISGPAWNVDRHMIRLQNITDAATIVTGSSEYTGTVNRASTRSFIRHKFTLAASKALEVQHRCEVTAATLGFGVASNFGVVETYTIAVFRKVG